eukprot:tig00020563_g11394.t1
MSRVFEASAAFQAVSLFPGARKVTPVSFEQRLQSAAGQQEGTTMGCRRNLKKEKRVRNRMNAKAFKAERAKGKASAGGYRKAAADHEQRKQDFLSSIFNKLEVREGRVL